MRTLPHSRSCFVCGESNPIGFQLRLETDDRTVQTHFVLRPEHVGFKQIVHGGLVSTLLDEVMAWACAVQAKRFAFCAELTVRFLRPVRPNEQLLAIGELIVNRRDKIFETKAKLLNAEGTLLASATGKYLPITQADALEMADDLVGDPQRVFGA